VKARRVPGLEPGGTLAENLRRIILVRLDELHGFMPQAADPAEVQALHDMRIAAKRLRYILEISEDCFGPYAATAAKRAKQVQDLVGEIHDCDETLPRVRALAAEAVDADARAVLARAAPDAEDLDPALAADAPHDGAHRGLATLLTFLAARRALLFDRFLELWTALEREGFRARLEYALDERPPTPFTSSSPEEGGVGVPSDPDLP
jgi:hypothetical protein